MFVFLQDWEHINFVFDHVYKELIQEIDEIDNNGGSGHSKTDITSRVAKLRKLFIGCALIYVSNLWINCPLGQFQTTASSEFSLILDLNGMMNVETMIMLLFRPWIWWEQSSLKPSGAWRNNFVWIIFHKIFLCSVWLVEAIGELDLLWGRNWTAICSNIHYCRDWNIVDAREKIGKRHDDHESGRVLFFDDDKPVKWCHCLLELEREAEIHGKHSNILFVVSR